MPLGYAAHDDHVGSVARRARRPCRSVVA
jgi:hypothetical protein